MTHDDVVHDAIKHAIKNAIGHVALLSFEHCGDVIDWKGWDREPVASYRKLAGINTS